MVRDEMSGYFADSKLRCHLGLDWRVFAMPFVFDVDFPLLKLVAEA